jgi:hypothetical protein
LAEGFAMDKKVSVVTTIALIGALSAALACARPLTTPLPQNVRRVAVLPPYRVGAPDSRTGSERNVQGLPPPTVEDLVAEQARVRLVEKGFEVIEPSVVKLATKGRAPTSSQMVAQIVRAANLDAAALYIEIRRWQPTPDERGMKADGVIVALDAMLIDPKSGSILWQVHRPSRPVPLYGVVLTSQAHRFTAETVMRELLQ